MPGPRFIVVHARTLGRAAATAGLVGALGLGLLGLPPPALPGTARPALPATAPPAGCLVVAVGAEPVVLDPHEASDSPSAVVNHHLYDNLVTLTTDLRIAPQLAVAWETSADGKRWTFHLRDGVRFHDGTPFDALAVKRNLDRLLDPDRSLARRSVLAPYVRSVSVGGRLTVHLDLHAPFAGLLHHLAHGAGGMISPQAFGADRGVGRAPVGTGPFRLARWLPGHELTLERHPDYWGSAPQASCIVFRPVPEAPSRVLLLQTGHADVAFPISPIDLSRLAADPALRVVSMPGQRVVYVGINLKRSPLDDVRVRRALNHAVDKVAIVEHVLLGAGEVARSAVASATWGFRQVGGYPYDPERARRLLGEAGVVPGTPLALWSPAGRYPMDRLVAEALHGYLTAVGFDVSLRYWEWGAYLSALQHRSAEVDLFLLGWVPSTGEAGMALRPLFESGSRANHTGYANPAVDGWLQQAARSASPDERRRLLALVQELVVADAPWIFLYSVMQTVALRAAVDGVEVYPHELISFRRAKKRGSGLPHGVE